MREFTDHLIHAMRLNAEDCDCLTCPGMRAWADDLESGLASPDDGPPFEILADCTCRGCVYNRQVLWLGSDLGNPEPNSD